MIELNVKFLQENSEEKQETKKKAITFFLNIPKFFKYHNFLKKKNFLISLKLLNIVKNIRIGYLCKGPDDRGIGETPLKTN